MNEFYCDWFHFSIVTNFFFALWISSAIVSQRYIVVLLSPITFRGSNDRVAFSEGAKQSVTCIISAKRQPFFRLRPTPLTELILVRRRGAQIGICLVKISKWDTQNVVLQGPQKWMHVLKKIGRIQCVSDFGLQVDWMILSLILLSMNNGNSEN